MLPGITPALFGVGVAGNDSFTKLLLHGDGVNGSSMFVDKSPAQHGVGFVNGPMVVSTGQSKFGGASIYDPATAYVTFPDHADWDFGAGDFTVDWWEFRAGAGTVICRGNIAAGYQAFMLSFSANRYCYMTSAAGAWDIANGRSAWGAVTNNVWTHLAITRQGNTFRAFKDGVITDTWTSSLALMAGGGAPLTIGGAQSSYFNGFIDELRISKGIARWTANFTPPTKAYAPDQSNQSGNGIDDNTVLLMHCDGTNGAAVFVDDSQLHQALTVAGVPVTSNGQIKFGSASAYFGTGGTGNRVVVPHHPSLNPNGAFTIEFWMFPTTNAFQMIPICKSNASSYAPYFINGNAVTSGRLAFYSSLNNGGWNIASAVDLGAFSLNVWTHVAVTWDGARWRGFVNGNLTMDFASSVLPAQGGDPVTIGSYAGGGYAIPGYMDEVRISNGIARWTAPFTPPPAPYGSAPQPATHFAVTAATPQSSGSPFNVTVQALDASNNPTSLYSGTVHITTNATGSVVLPPDATLTGGVGIFPVTLRPPGTWTVTATDTVTGSINGTSGSIVVGPATPQVIALTAVGAGTWTVPASWNNANNSIEVIGGGGGGQSGFPGGGGGAYAKLANVTMVPGAVKNWVVGGGGNGGAMASGLPGGVGGNTFFRIDSGNTSPANTSQGVVAIGGGAGNGTGGAGGAAAASLGTTKFDGGNGSDGDSGGTGINGGGGGAAGPNGAGVNAHPTNGAGGAGDAGFGGAGGPAGGGGGYGGNGAEWALTAGGTVGAGGGAGAGSSFSGGNYGGGGCGSYQGGAGMSGLIVIRWTPTG